MIEGVQGIIRKDNLLLKGINVKKTINTVHFELYPNPNQYNLYFGSYFCLN